MSPDYFVTYLPDRSDCQQTPHARHPHPRLPPLPMLGAPRRAGRKARSACGSGVPETVSGDASARHHGWAGHRRGTSSLPAAAAPWDGARASRHRTRNPVPCHIPHGTGPCASVPPVSPTGRPAALGHAGSAAGATRAWYADVLHWPAASVCPRPLPARVSSTGGVPSWCAHGTWPCTCSMSLAGWAQPLALGSVSSSFFYAAGV
jgi:hypothetical protein